MYAETGGKPLQDILPYTPSFNIQCPDPPVPQVDFHAPDKDGMAASPVHACIPFHIKNSKGNLSRIIFCKAVGALEKKLPGTEKVSVPAGDVKGRIAIPAPGVDISPLKIKHEEKRRCIIHGRGKIQGQFPVRPVHHIDFRTFFIGVDDSKQVIGMNGFHHPVLLSHAFTRT